MSKLSSRKSTDLKVRYISRSGREMGMEGGELTASGLPMTEATVLEASARMAEVSTPSRFTFVDTFRHGILVRFRFRRGLLLFSPPALMDGPPLLQS
ncbi:hypothetical protein PR202_gb16639 [Eleusine coracana subsp. coracana]|uniref:Uncharacterized protein n=1 Tax=Eleusine coracana subsp. coracana TaxID=191504 RepID=A0AAV5F0X6_ELECO|nr:hypothetical protein PR202_gb16639 [Eleusine coracana subsp. coracana]